MCRNDFVAPLHGWTAAFNDHQQYLAGAVIFKQIIFRIAKLDTLSFLNVVIFWAIFVERITLRLTVGQVYSYVWNLQIVTLFSNVKCWLKTAQSWDLYDNTSYRSNPITWKLFLSINWSTLTTGLSHVDSMSSWDCWCLSKLFRLECLHFDIELTLVSSLIVSIIELNCSFIKCIFRTMSIISAYHNQFVKNSLLNYKVAYSLTL